MTVQLIPLAADEDIRALVGRLVPLFGTDASLARHVLAHAFDLLIGEPRPDPWGCYLAHVDEEPVGACAFKTAPNGEGEVELSYMTFPACEGRGYATAMIGALTGIAFEAGVPRVIAHTLREENASNRALQRAGFAYAGEHEDPEDGEVWRWERLA